MKKVGCLGGTFDPIHLGHLELAKKVMKTYHLDEIWFLPTKSTPLKDREISPFLTRVKMIKLAIKPYRKFKLCLIENELPSPSYTITTVKECMKRYPDIQFHWIVGDDQASQFDKWKDIDELLSLIQFIVAKRSDMNIQDDRLWLLESFNHTASSTRVRSGIFTDCPKSVRNYMLNKQLYIDDIVYARCSKKRAKHVFSMAEVCVTLAKCHGVDVQLAKIAGLLHDICKDVSVEENMAVMKHYYPEYSHFSYPIVHSFTAPIWIKQNMGYTNKKVLRAIENHTLCNTKSKLAYIVFIADKIDPSRGYDSRALFDIAKRDLHEGYKKVCQERDSYLYKANIDVEKRLKMEKK